MPDPHAVEPHKHDVRKHNDAKKPYCKECGLTEDYRLPDIGNHFPAAPPTPLRDRQTALAKQDLMSEFSYSSRPHSEAIIARPFCELAWKMHEELPDGPSKIQCLQSIRNAMNSALRAEVSGQSATSETKPEK